MRCQLNEYALINHLKRMEKASFGSDSPMERAGMPNEVAPSYLFLASEDSTYINGQVLHPNGGEIINC